MHSPGAQCSTQESFFTLARNFMMSEFTPLKAIFC